MLIGEHKEETKAEPGAIWQVWQAVDQWNSWDHDLEWSRIDGLFQAGTSGTLKPRGGPAVPFCLTEVEPRRLFVVASKLFLARCLFSHWIEQSAGKTVVVHRIEMKGPFAWLFALLLGRSMEKNLPTAMQVMLKKAESL